MSLDFHHEKFLYQEHGTIINKDYSKFIPSSAPKKKKTPQP
jgi:hypothetical protein